MGLVKTNNKDINKSLQKSKASYCIFTINKTTGVALKLSDIEVNQIKNNFSKYSSKINQGNYFIYRWNNNLSATSKETIFRINGSIKLNNKYIRIAFTTLQNLIKENNGNIFPSNFFEIFAKLVFTNILMNTVNPDNDIHEIKKQLGVNVGDANKELLCMYHLYESVIRRNRSDIWGGYDKVQHFIYSACVQYDYGPNVADIAQITGEFYDLYEGDSITESKNDMYANNLGQKYGASLFKKYHPYKSKVPSVHNDEA